jgi:flagellar biosynthesis protein FlhF
MGALAAFVDATRAEPLLVLAAGADAMEAGDVATAFAGIGCRRIIATRLDVARRLGALLSAADIGRLALAGATAGPHAAEAVSTLSPFSLGRLLLSTTPRHVPLVEPEEALR